MKKKLQVKIEKETQTEVNMVVFDSNNNFGIRVHAHKDRAGNTLFCVQKTNGEAGVPTGIVFTKMVGENLEIGKDEQ